LDLSIIITLRRRDIEQPSLESPFIIPGFVFRTYTVFMCDRMLSNVNSKWGLTCQTESTLIIIIYNACAYVCAWLLTPTGYKICVNLHGSGPCTMGITLVIVQPVWRTFKSLSNIRWNGNTWQNVAGLIFGSTEI